MQKALTLFFLWARLHQPISGQLQPFRQLKTTVLARLQEDCAPDFHTMWWQQIPLARVKARIAFTPISRQADVEVTAMYGTDSEPWRLEGDAPFYQDPFGSDFGGQVNPLLFANFPSLEYDTWWTIGAAPGDADGLNSAFDEALTSFDDWNNGGDFVVNTFIGGSIFVVPGANGQGQPHQRSCTAWAVHDVRHHRSIDQHPD